MLRFKLYHAKILRIRRNYEGSSLRSPDIQDFMRIYEAAPSCAALTRNSIEAYATTVHTFFFYIVPYLMFFIHEGDFSQKREIQ